jgi:hypothetical protein
MVQKRTNWFLTILLVIMVLITLYSDLFFNQLIGIVGTIITTMLWMVHTTFGKWLLGRVND